MSKQLIEAVFEHGVLRPLTEIQPPIPEGQQVRLLVETDEPLPYALELATSVYDGLTEREVEEIERIALGYLRLPENWRTVAWFVGSSGSRTMGN